MAYKALYRTYRPRLFAQVVGQEHITTVLLHQVREGQFSHAYLFSGSRGTGKTSTAKIFARAVNCTQPKEGEPCNACPACLASAVETADIVEIDAASNNGVDNVRELIEQAQYAPLQLTHRVFIIDEVHMLSTAAFNALLKTLEEPPAHVLFILATTEPQKLPATIISRCQRFDFHRLTSAHIVANLQSVLKQAGAEIEVGGLLVLARLADGSMRDALSLADQCLSFCAGKVGETDVYDVLGSVDADELLRFAAELAARNAATCLAMLGQVVAKGRDLTVFVNDLTYTARSLLLAKLCGDCTELLDCTPETMDKLQRLSAKTDEDALLYMMEQLVETLGALRYYSSPRVLVESALMRICRPADEESLRALAIRVAQLESKLSNAQSGEDLLVPTVGVAIGRPPQEEETPPWEAIPEPEPPSETKQTAPLSTPNSPPSPNSSCEEFWQNCLQHLQKLNALVYASVKEGVAKSLGDGQLAVEFPLTAAGKYNLAKSPASFAKAQQAVHMVDGGVTLHFHLEKPTATESDLIAMFGDRLTIE